MTFAQQTEFIFSTLQDALGLPCWARSLAMNLREDLEGTGEA